MEAATSKLPLDKEKELITGFLEGLGQDDYHFVGGSLIIVTKKPDSPLQKP